MPAGVIDHARVTSVLETGKDVEITFDMEDSLNDPVQEQDVPGGQFFDIKRSLIINRGDYSDAEATARIQEIMNIVKADVEASPSIGISPSTIIILSP